MSAFRSNAQGSERPQSLFATLGVYCLAYLVLYAVAGKFLIVYRANMFGWLTTGLSDMVFFVLGMGALILGLIAVGTRFIANPVIAAVLSVLVFVSVYLVGYTAAFLPVALVVAVVAWVVGGMLNPGFNRAVIALFAACLFLLIVFIGRVLCILPYAQVDSSEFGAKEGVDSISVSEWTSSNVDEQTDLLGRFVSARCTRFGIKNPPKVAAVALPARFFPTKGYYDEASNTIFVNVVSMNEPLDEPKEGQEVEYAPEAAIEGTLHAIAHLYQSQRVGGEIPASKNWPYPDGMPVKDAEKTEDGGSGTWPDEVAEYGFNESALNGAEETPSIEDQADSFEGYAKSYITTA